MTSRTDPKSPRRGRRARKQAGFSLVEVLVSVVVLASGTVLVSQAFAQVWHALTVAERQSTAYLFALSKMAELELSLRERHELEEPQQGAFRVGVQPFEWQAFTSDMPNDPPLKSLTLVVTWPRGSYTDHRRLDTLFSAATATP